VRIFGADVYVAHRRADRDGGDRHAFDEEEGVALHQHTVGEGAAVALVGVADDVFLFRLRAGDRAPLDARREACAAAAAQAGGHNLLDRRLGTQRQGAGQPREPAMAPVVVERKRVGHAAAGEDEALLPSQIGNVLDPSERLRMAATGQKPGVEQQRGVLGRQGTVTGSTFWRLDLDERLQPEKAAGAGPHDRNLEAANARLLRQSRGHGVRADGERGGIRRNEDARAHWVSPFAPATIASSRSRSSRPIGAPSSSAAGERAQLPRQ